MVQLHVKLFFAFILALAAIAPAVALPLPKKDPEKQLSASAPPANPHNIHLKSDVFAPPPKANS